MKFKPLVLTTLTATAMVGLSACGTETNDTAESITQEPATPAVPAEVVLGQEDAPADYTFSDIGAFLENQAAAGEGSQAAFDELYVTQEGTTTQPEQCAPLAPTAVTTLLTLHEHPADAAAVDYVSPDNATVITVLVTTEASEAAPTVDLEQCAEFTRSTQVADSDISVTYDAEPREVSLDGAEDVTAAHLTTTAVSINGGDFAPPTAEESELTLTGTTDGIRFQVHATGPGDEQVLDELAQTQVDKIRSR